MKLARDVSEMQIVDVHLRLAVQPPERALLGLIWSLLGNSRASLRDLGSTILAQHGSLGQGDSAGTARSGERPPPSSRTARGRLQTLLKEEQARAKHLAGTAASAQDHLAEARRQTAQSEEKLAQARRALVDARAEVTSLRQEGDKLRQDLERSAAADLGRLSEMLTTLRKKVDSRNEELDAFRRREAELLTRLREAESHGAINPVREPAEPRQIQGAGPWLIPHFTPEFYASIRRWDNRIVKTTFEKVLLFCQNPAHPGIEAKAMHGVDGLYRIFVAQDVRLFYARNTGNRVDILSLVDRENLDRYIRNWKP
jgi:hypothetical protein